jgi:hypothetical protein
MSGFPSPKREALPTMIDCRKIAKESKPALMSANGNVVNDSNVDASMADVAESSLASALSGAVG